MASGTWRLGSGMPAGAVGTETGLANSITATQARMASDTAIEMGPAGPST